MHALPPELLFMIFRYACFTNNVSDTLTTVRLSHVDRSWRRVTIASPSLWSSITYQSPFGYHHNYVALQKLMTYVERSGSSPLTLFLHLCNKDDEGFQILLEHSMRWKSLTLRCMHSLVPIVSRLLRKAPVPLLESMCATAFPTGRHQDEDSSGPSPASIGQIPCSIFSGGAPKLRLLELGNATVYYMRPVHLETLSTLHFHSSFSDLELSPSELYTILTIPNLTTLTILAEFWELIPDIADISSSRIVMSKLRYLAIRGGSDYEVMRIFATLSCPLVEVLMIQNIFMTTNVYDSPTDIDSRVPEVLKKLHTLHLTDNCEISASLHPFLKQICAPLKELVFDTGASESFALGSILLPLNEDGTVPKIPPIVFPELETMVIRSVDKRDAQHLMVILPGLEAQGRPVESIAVGPELVDMWSETGHIDGLRKMNVRMLREGEVDVAMPLWVYPPRTLIYSDSEEYPLSPDSD
ncbi:hypothetical protein AGABI1DRAFT_124813 [Agaricus bisporus var. burnettii JB137-S8]|uniref:F-box domain-containing protein n=1 Tax=Agaricus bisporus var. burnettii (strain JB137-S8 / ATCC MYA-4627 / FGSC 10392) TaxID=597362 RepID=K5XFY2_AGABU|nr:uncharacterized protein AGABI1DRAFT_124813 [Agaricus bisporus var. burnettii JB137-S8]EKM82333.1 hypothetical protein AGABI1DRAFT_124813 [Agaricus bisporus var. burnettii JB137-S8]